MDLTLNLEATITPTQAAAAIGATLSVSSNKWEFETYGATFPAGMTLTYTKLHGTPTEAGTWTVQLNDMDPYGSPAYTYAVALVVVDPDAPEPEPEPEPSKPEALRLTPAVIAFLALPETPQTITLVNQHVRVVTTFVRAYVRGRGFLPDGEPNLDLEDVIVSAASRYVVNPQQLTRQALGNQSVSYAALEGFTLAEKAVLHNYRRRAG